MGILEGLLSPGLTQVAKARGAYLSGKRQAEQEGVAASLAALKAKREAESAAITDALHQAQTKKALQLPEPSLPRIVFSTPQADEHGNIVGGGEPYEVTPEGLRRAKILDDAPKPPVAAGSDVAPLPDQGTPTGGGQSSAATKAPVFGRPVTPPKTPEPDRTLVPVQQPDGSVIYVKREAAAGQHAPTPGSMGGAALQKAIASNKTQLATIDDALKELDLHPNAVGLMRGIGEVVGSMPVIGGSAAAAQDAVNQRLDPEGNKARASLANIGSLVIHDRSGAAVTVSEFPRLKPFVPTVQDTPQAIRDKLAKLRQAIETETGFLSAGRGPAGGGTPSPLSALRAAAEAQLRAQGMTPEQILKELGPPDGDD